MRLAGGVRQCPAALAEPLNLAKPIFALGESRISRCILVPSRLSRKLDEPVPARPISGRPFRLSIRPSPQASTCSAAVSFRMLSLICLSFSAIGSEPSCRRGGCRRPPACSPDFPSDLLDAGIGFCAAPVSERDGAQASALAKPPACPWPPTRASSSRPLPRLSSPSSHGPSLTPGFGSP